MLNPSPYRNMTMKQMVARKLVENPAGINQTVTAALSPAESQRNWNIQANFGQKNFMGDVVTRVILPHDTPDSQRHRELEYRRQIAQPWESVFMNTSTDLQRLNNPAQASFVNQRQLTIPSTAGQFYAFMHALSAAFGTLQ